MITAKELREMNEKKDETLVELIEKLEQDILRANNNGDLYTSFNLCLYQEYSDNLIDHLEKYGYNASWNDCLLSIEISWSK